MNALDLLCEFQGRVDSLNMDVAAGRKRIHDMAYKASPVERLVNKANTNKKAVFDFFKNKRQLDAAFQSAINHAMETYGIPDVASDVERYTTQYDDPQRTTEQPVGFDLDDSICLNSREIWLFAHCELNKGTGVITFSVTPYQYGACPDRRTFDYASYQPTAPTCVPTSELGSTLLSLCADATRKTDDTSLRHRYLSETIGMSLDKKKEWCRQHGAQDILSEIHSCLTN